MDALYRRGRASVAELRQDLPDPPTSSAIRTMLQRLEAKGHIAHRREGARNVYLPIVPRDRAREFALDRLVTTFFEGSPLAAAAALLDRSAAELSPEELDRLEELVERARKRGR
jgi:predicted transcriptional regulator